LRTTQGIPCHQSKEIKTWAHITHPSIRNSFFIDDDGEEDGDGEDTEEEELG